ncbi:MAG: DUF1569 domain-containing protein [Bacteroidetes bacterium]|nr:DUF1569 domain-containing protein [Bacteroidota bacterium]
MKKNLFQKESKEEILSRIHKLNKDSQRLWGKMNVNQMLYHNAASIHIAYGEIKATAQGNWLSRQLMRYIIFKTDIPAPKEKANTFPEVDTVALNINPTDFNAEKNKVVNLLENFPAKPLYPTSPLLGKMTDENWARLLYTHFDHHLKQFGV